MRMLLIAGATLLASTSAQAAVNLSTNGGFELGTAIAGPTYLAGGDTTSITGWVVQARGVNYVDETPGTGWDAAGGSRSVELTTAAGNGGIYQNISGFIVGRLYQISFQVSANPYDTNPRPRAARVRYSISGNVDSYDYTLNNVNTASNMLYDTVTSRFIASATMQRLGIRSAVSGSFGPVIDNVAISAIPEPASWAMLVAGFGLVGFAARRRNRGAVAA